MESMGRKDVCILGFSFEIESFKSLQEILAHARGTCHPHPARKRFNNSVVQFLAEESLHASQLIPCGLFRMFVR